LRKFFYRTQRAARKILIARLARELELACRVFTYVALYGVVICPHRDSLPIRHDNNARFAATDTQQARMVNASVTHKGKNQRVRQSKFDIQSPGNLRKPLGARASRPHHLEKCGLEARVPGKKRGFRSLPLG